MAVFWFRRDLRLEDNTGLYHALSSGYKVIPVFIFDINILDKIENKKDKRITFIFGALDAMQKKLVAAGSSLIVRYGKPEEVLPGLLQEFSIKALYANNDYEPYALERDRKISKILEASGIPFHTFKDQVIFEKGEVVKPDRTPYTVFTPYSRTWKKLFAEKHITSFTSEKIAGNFARLKPLPFPSIKNLGFEETAYSFSEPVVDHDLIKNYHNTRNIPAISGTTRLGVHLRFGTISIRQLVKTALELNDVWLNELIWREFFMSILWHFPSVTEYSFRRKYDNIIWRNKEEEFKRWREGMTGYPIVDAGMRELRETGFMHNRVRMITASFLAKHLLIDWRWGEAWFAENLLDFELSSNNGNWQWAAGCGCDAAPYFRVFNPSEQTRKFDPDHTYIKKWIPELGTTRYPQPVVDHALARQRAIRTYFEGIR